jgi:hypothetical protein
MGLKRAEKGVVLQKQGATWGNFGSADANLKPNLGAVE